jgi:endoglucanase
MSKRTGISALIMVSLPVLVIFALTSCMSEAEKAKRDQNTRKAFQMNKLLGRGVNLGNALEAPKEGEWGVTLQEEYFQIIKDAGFNSVRIPVRWSGHASMEPLYIIDPKFFERVDWAINCALSRNLPVILNMHHYRELYTDPLPHKKRFMAIWKQIAEHYKDYPDTLLLEIFNEPDDALTPKMWNEWLKEAHAIIRKANPTKTIVIGSANDSWITYLKLLELPEDDRNIIVTVHHYFPHEFTHQGASWMTREKIAKSIEDMKFVHQELPAGATSFDGDSNTWLGTTWTGTDAEKKAMTDIFDIGAAWGKKHNRPINLGEFGSYKKADMDSRVRWTKFIADTAAERDMSLHYWEFCADEFGLYDRKAKTWRKELLEAVIPPKL